MKVQHISVGLPRELPGGLNRFAMELSSAQVQSGIDAELLVLGSPISDDPSHVRVVGPAHPGLVRRQTSFRRAVRRAASVTDIVDIHFAWHALSSIPAIAPRNAPRVVHFHGPWAAESLAVGESGTAAAIKKTIERAVYGRAQHFITLTEVFRTLLHDVYGVPESQITVIPPGVDTARFNPGDRSQARRNLGIPEDGPLIVAVRRLVPRMGLLDLLRAVEPLGVRVLLVGDGPMRAELEVEAMRLGMLERVTFAGKLPEGKLADAYRAADLSVVPTLELEGFGLVALESIACDTPVVARAQGGLIEALAGFDPRSLIEDRSVDALSQGIAAMLARPTPAVENRRFISGRTWRETVRRTTQIYDGVLARG